MLSSCDLGDSSLQEPTNKCRTLRGGSMQERTGVMLALALVGLTWTIGHCKRMTGKKRKRVSLVVYEEC